MCDPWIEPLFGHKLINPKDFKSKHGFFLCLFRKKKPKGKYVLSCIAKVVGYSSLKKDTIGKSAKAIEGQEKNPKEKVQRLKKKFVVQINMYK